MRGRAWYGARRFHCRRPFGHSGENLISDFPIFQADSRSLAPPRWQVLKISSIKRFGKRSECDRFEQLKSAELDLC